MNQIKWDSELSVGVEEIDEQHQELIGIANTLLAAVADGSQADITRIIKRLRDYTVFHFNSEEELMTESRYPKRSEHKSLHGRLKLDVKTFQRQLYEDQKPNTAMVLKFLKVWLLEHILTHDREFARYLKEQPKETTWAVIGK